MPSFLEVKELSKLISNIDLSFPNYNYAIH